MRQRAWRLEFCEADQLLPPPLRARQAICLDRAPPPNKENPQKRTPTRSRHRRAANLDRAEHQVCKFFKPAVQTTRIVLAIRTFDGPVLRATRNSVILTMWLAPPCPTLARPGDIDQKIITVLPRSAQCAPRHPTLDPRPPEPPAPRTASRYPPSRANYPAALHTASARHSKTPAGHLAHLAETYGWRSLP